MRVIALASTPGFPGTGGNGVAFSLGDQQQRTPLQGGEVVILHARIHAANHAGMGALDEITDRFLGKIVAAVVKDSIIPVRIFGFRRGIGIQRFGV